MFCPDTVDTIRPARSTVNCVNRLVGSVTPGRLTCLVVGGCGDVAERARARGRVAGVVVAGGGRVVERAPTDPFGLGGGLLPTQFVVGRRAVRAARVGRVGEFTTTVVGVGPRRSRLRAGPVGVRFGTGQRAAVLVVGQCRLVVQRVMSAAGSPRAL